METEQKAVDTAISEFSGKLEEMTKLVAQSDEERKAMGAVSEKTSKAVSDLDASLKQLTEDAVGEQKALNERIEELEKKANRPGFGEPAEEMKSAGRKFIESDAYKARGEALMTPPVPVGQFFKKELSSDALSGGALVDPMRLAEIFKAPDRPPTLRELLGSGRTTSNAIEFIQESGFFNVYSTLTADYPAGTETVFAMVSVGGLYAGQNITIDGNAAVIASVDATALTVTTVADLGVGVAIGDVVTSPVFGPTPEGTLKPEMNLTYSLQTADVRTIAHFLPATRQIIEDAAALETQINQRLLYGLQISEEQQILYGDGTGVNLLGLLANPGRQTLAWSGTPTGSTKIDAIRRAITLARVAEYPVTAIVLHPTEWADIELEKGTDDRYVWVNVPDGGVPRLWRVPVVDTTAIAAGTALLGAFSMGASIFDRAAASIRISDSHADFFTTNRIAILAEERIALATYRPEAFVDLTFDAAP